MSLAYTPNGRALLSAGQDGTVSLWDGRRGTLVGTVTAEGSAGAFVQPLPDGAHVVIATASGHAYRWNLRPSSWLRVACRTAGREITGQEWRSALGDRPFAPVCPH